MRNLMFTFPLMIRRKQSRRHDHRLLLSIKLSTNITFFCTREQGLLAYFNKNKTSNGNFVYCQNIQGLLKRMGVKEYLPGEWRLFVDSNIRNMKCVLLYNGHEYSPVPIRQSINVREIRRNKNGFKPSEIPGILLDNLRSLKNGKFFYWYNKAVTPSNPAFCVISAIELKNDIGCREKCRRNVNIRKTTG